jgi:hypothetical protein
VTSTKGPRRYQNTGERSLATTKVIELARLALKAKNETTRVAATRESSPITQRKTAQHLRSAERLRKSRVARLVTGGPPVLLKAEGSRAPLFLEALASRSTEF